MIAVSGGVDSVSLLHLLLPLSGHYDWRLIVAHLDHGLRKSASRDALFVEKLAGSLGLKFVGELKDVQRLAKSRKMTIEEAGRSARYDFLRRTAKKYKTSVIVTAHTADDQMETIIMNWLRGASIRGLAGMKEWENGIWRPLLDVEKKALRQFAKQYKIDYREDKSNRQLNYTRNRVRHLLVPQLLSLNPGLRDVLLRNAQVFSGLERWLDQEVAQAYKKVTVSSKRGMVSFRRTAFMELPLFMQDELLLYAVDHLQGNKQGFKQAHIQQMRQVLESFKPESHKQLPAKLFLIKTCDKITISRYRPKNL